MTPGPVSDDSIRAKVLDRSRPMTIAAHQVTANVSACCLSETRRDRRTHLLAHLDVLDAALSLVQLYLKLSNRDVAELELPHGLVALLL